MEAIIQTPFSIILTAAKKVKETVEKVFYPSPSKPPLGINPKAQEKYWKEFCKKYSKLWRKYEAGPDAWACCVAIWKNYCFKRKIVPFSLEDNKTLNKDTKKNLIDRTTNGRKAQLDLIKMLERTGKDKGVLKKVFAETFFVFDKPKPGVFTVTTNCKLRLFDNITTKSPEFKQWMARHAFENKRGVFKRGLKGGAELWVKEVGTTPKKQDVRFLLTNTFTNAQLQYILGLNEVDIKDDSKVKKALVSYWRKLMKKKLK